MPLPADLILRNGRVLTLDDDFGTADALAVRAGRIVAVGTDAEVRPHAGPRTEVVDLAGRTALPGVNDSHLHACAFGATRPPLAADVGYPAVDSIAAAARAVAAHAAQLPPGAWAVGHGWDVGYLAECRADPSRTPHRRDLDALIPDRPVLLYEFSGHTAWLNTAALKAAGIDRDTVAPSGGIIERDADGEATGLLRESAQNLVNAAIPPMTRAERERAVRAAVALCHAEGITSFTEPGLGPGGRSLFLGAAGAETLQVYADLAAAGELQARVSVLLLPLAMGESAAALPARLAAAHPASDADPRLLRVIGVKVFADGIPPSRTAWMHDEYVGGGRGCLCLHGDSDGQRVGELAEIVHAAHAAGYQLGVHVTGDQGIDAVVDAFAAARAHHPRTDERHYVIHGDFVTPASLRTLAAHGWSVNMNPAIKWTIADLMDDVVGPERSAYQWPVRSAVEAGIPVAASSDAPITYPDWRRGVASMLLRESKATGRPSGPEQRVDLATALRAYTVNAARQDFAESWKGRLAVGMAADVCVLGGDLLAADPHEIPDLPVDLTVFDGSIVYGKA
ncbi:amidohydrolase [Yinghuangia seranimata]|uniref:amidohydrolase n=1 Tax=Yinghuangia seranimata TaxID=408067 RepID=UPI00248C64B9|nr:amidohydrolase [Yinghuangia seranimata]MDI2132728.1 amidohydrolase [Yinghuangia seranimata]